MARLMRASIFLQLVLSSLPLCARAHMEMSWPYPIRSQLDPDVALANRDYSYTSPLLQDGSNFPCKGYQNGVDSNVTKATYIVGGTYNMTIAGSVTHDGGSCQLSLSYDNGATFKVIQSMIGGCPLVPGYNFTIPSFAPAGTQVLLAWSWFNLIGNREMYMDCARVEIQAPSLGRHRRSSAWASKRQASMDQLPDMFTCNVANGCTTIEGENVNFPYPGTNIIYGQDLITPTNGTGFTGSEFAGDSPPNGTFNGTTDANFPFDNSTSPNTRYPANTTFSTSSSFISLATLISTNLDSAMLVGSSLSSFTIDGTVTSVTVDGLLSSFTTATSTPSLSARSIVTSRTASTGFTVLPIPTPLSSSSKIYEFVTQAPSVSVTQSCPETAQEASASRSFSISYLLLLTLTTSTVPSAPVVSATPQTTCTPGAFFCDTPSTFSTCAYSGDYIYVGSVSAGMECSNGQIIRQNDGPCTPNGHLFCDGTNAFYICDQGGLIDMGPVAPGNECASGSITRKRF